MQFEINTNGKTTWTDCLDACKRAADEARNQERDISVIRYREDGSYRVIASGYYSFVFGFYSFSADWRF